MSGNLAKAITDAVVRRLAGERSYQQGLDYFSGGHVESLEDLEGSVRAVVHSDLNYTVTLAANDGVLDYSCNCAVGIDGAFCNHCVAAALAWLGRAPGKEKSSGRGKPKKVTLANAEKILKSEDKDALVRMLLDWAQDDPKLRERLIIFAASRLGSDTAIAAVKKAFEKATRAGNIMYLPDVRIWTRGVDSAIDSVEKLLNDGHATAFIDLCEGGLASVAYASQQVNDSPIHFENLRDRLQNIHYRACQEARPDSVELAKRFFAWELRSSFGVFRGALKRYKEILGVNGVKAYRELAEAEWQRVPALAAGHKVSRRDEHGGITRIMESLARESGDIEQLVAVMSRDLSMAYNYLSIAEVYRQVGQFDKALLWAEKGLRDFPNRTDDRLCEFAAAEYHRLSRHEDAMKLIWATFLERPYLKAYKTLESHAKKAGAWPDWRERALSEIRQRAPKNMGNPVRWRGVLPDDNNSTMVEIFLYEANPEEAWREAQVGGCSDDLWVKLAAACETQQPEGAVAIYMKEAEAAIPGAHYKQSVKLLLMAAEVMRRMGRSAEFISQLEALRLKYRLNLNFFKLVEVNRKTLYL